MDICLKGSNGAEKIILRVFEIGPFPDEDGFPLSYEIIVDSSWCHVYGYKHFSFSGVLMGFRDALQNCYDTLTATVTSGEVTLEVLGAPPCPAEKNTAYRAAQVFLRETGINGGAALTLTKRIPQQAGMGGGSADAAAALIALDRLYDTRLSVDELCTMGLQVGADVPFCVLGGTAMVTGIGEGLAPLPALPDCFIVVAQPTDGVSTAAAYAALDNAPIPHHPDNAAVMREIIKAEAKHRLVLMVTHKAEDTSEMDASIIDISAR